MISVSNVMLVIGDRAAFFLHNPYMPKESAKLNATQGPLPNCIVM